MSGWLAIPHLRNFNVKLWSNSKTNIQRDERKDENYILLSINAGGIIKRKNNCPLICTCKKYVKAILCLRNMLYLIHRHNTIALANWTLGFLRQNLYACPQEVKEAANKRLVHSVLEYSGSVWDPSGAGLQNELEKVQNRAVRFCNRKL